MKTAQELYPECVPEEQKNDFFEAPNDYRPILGEFGEILIQVDDDDYQGDSRILYRNGVYLGWLQFGWGSCNGCDALQGCESMEQVQLLINELRNQIKWFENKTEAIQFFENHDWKGDYSWHEEKQQEFVTKSLAMLRTFSV